MNFSIEHDRNDGTTFSAEALVTNMEMIMKYLETSVARALQEGFNTKKPLTKLEVKIEVKANGEAKEYDVFGAEGGYTLDANVLAKQIVMNAQERLRDTSHSTGGNQK